MYAGMDLALRPADRSNSAEAPTTERRPSVDAGWLFLIAGVAVIGAVVLIPAADDLAEAKWKRDRAALVEGHRQDRLDNYGEYLGAVERGEPSLVRSLAAVQLNQIPADRKPVAGLTDDPASGRVGNTPGTADASVFPALEPPDLKVQPRVRPDSALSKLIENERTRTWLIAGGAVCILIGLLPPARRLGR